MCLPLGCDMRSPSTVVQSLTQLESRGGKKSKILVVISTIGSCSKESGSISGGGLELW